MMSHMLSPTTKQCPIMSDTGSIVRRSRFKTEAAEPVSLQDRSRGAGLAPRPKPRSRPRFQAHGLCHDLTSAIGQIISAKTYVNMFEGPVIGNIPEVLDNGEVTDGTHVTAGQLALALTPYTQVTDLAVNTAASGNNAAAIQSLDDRVTAELASKLDGSALAPLATAAAGGRAQKQHRRAAELADHGSLQQGRPVGLRRAGGCGGHEEHPGPEAVQLQHHGSHLGQWRPTSTP